MRMAPVLEYSNGDWAGVLEGREKEVDGHIQALQTEIARGFSN